jgi:hypothetical protein
MSTIRIPLVGPYNNRESSASAGGKDLRLVNCFSETIGDKQYIVKRPGLSLIYQQIAGTPQGIATWGDNIYYVIGGILYKNASPMTDTDLATLSSATQVDFSIGKDSAGNEVLFMSDQASLWMIESDDDVTVENPSSPASWVYGMEFFDGYIFIMDSEGTIYNGLNAFAGSDPLDFSAPDTLTVGRGFGGIAVCLKAFNNYILAFKRNGIEFFYDAGNATGSPLSPYRSYASDVGCISGATVARTEETVLWLGQSTGGGVGVYLLNGLKPQKVSTSAIDKILEAEGDTLDESSGFHIKVGGHYFYILSLNTLGRTLVYDLSEDQWEEWGYYVNEGGTEVGTDFRYITNYSYSETVSSNENLSSPCVAYMGTGSNDGWWLVAGATVDGYNGFTTFNIDTTEGTIEKVAHTKGASTVIRPSTGNPYLAFRSFDSAFMYYDTYSSSINVETTTVNSTTGAWTINGCPDYLMPLGEYNGASYDWVLGASYGCGGAFGGNTIFAYRFNGTTLSGTGAVSLNISTDVGGTSTGTCASGAVGSNNFIFLARNSTSRYLMYYTFNESAFTFKTKLEVTTDYTTAHWRMLIDGSYLYVLGGDKIIAYSYSASAITKITSYSTGVSTANGSWCLVSPGKIAYLNTTSGSGQLNILTFNGSSFSLQASYVFPTTLFVGNLGSVGSNGQYIVVAGRNDKTTVDPLVLYLFYAVPESVFKGSGVGNSLGTKALVLDSESGALYEVDSNVYTDNGESISVQIITDKLDGGTNQSKIGNRLEIIGDYQTSSGTLEINWSDDDYKNFSTAREVDVSDRMILTRLGRFQRRAFKLVHEENAPLRLEALELDFDLVGYGQ